MLRRVILCVNVGFDASISSVEGNGSVGFKVATNLPIRRLENDIMTGECLHKCLVLDATKEQRTTHIGIKFAVGAADIQ